MKKNRKTTENGGAAESAARLFAAAAMLTATIAAQAAATPPKTASPFGDGMVLQRDKPAPVWGKAAPGEKISVSFAGRTVTTAAGADGRWRVSLPPMPASKTSRTLTVKSLDSGTERAFRDVLVGEVWLASGQSNMALLIWSGDPRVRDRNGAAVMQIVRNREVRYANLLDWQTSDTPQDSIGTFVWREHRPENVGRGWDGGQSAVAFYFAELIHQALDVPVGMIVACAGGTPIKPFFVGNPVWNHYFAPTAPYACRGLIWYQGESDPAYGEEEYVAQLKKFLDGWSAAFENPGLPMCIAQICSGGAVARAQALFARRDTRAHTAVTYDVGNPWDIHPNEKFTVGLRLALLALKYEYGWSDIRAESPSPRSARVETGGAVRIAFDNAVSFYSYARDHSAKTSFELAGKDGKWHPAALANQIGRKTGKDGRETCHGEFSGVQLVLSSPEVPEPCKVRNCADPRLAVVYNESALPIGPFEMSLPAEAVPPPEAGEFSAHIGAVGAAKVLERFNQLAGAPKPVGAPAAGRAVKVAMIGANGKGLSSAAAGVKLSTAYEEIIAGKADSIVIDFTGVVWEEEPVVYFAADWVKTRLTDAWGL
ncbi:MAG: hypothetical protein J6T01_03855 [Kiritimatiellae bacterium]|nr:hypothetical protein [Kiritimatiellia bacterium]